MGDIPEEWFYDEEEKKEKEKIGAGRMLLKLFPAGTNHMT